MDSRALAELQALARRDTELSIAIGRLEQVEGEVARIRSRLEVIDGFFASYPTEEHRIQADLREAERDLMKRREELTDAERALVSATDQDREQARMAIVRAHDRIETAEARLRRDQQALEGLQRERIDFPAELLRLESKARELSAEPPNLVPPRTEPGALLIWATQAHATLLVAHSQLATDRDRIIREASEIATMLTGVATYGETAAQALKRAEIQR